MVWTEESFKTHPKANRYKDFRVMFEKQKDIDAVVISTPDHTHGVVASMAIKLGKHVYLEKPLAHSVFETRELTRLGHKKELTNLHSKTRGFRRTR